MHACSLNWFQDVTHYVTPYTTIQYSDFKRNVLQGGAEGSYNYNYKRVTDGPSTPHMKHGTGSGANMSKLSLETLCSTFHEKATYYDDAKG